jgi:hypothetical protein
MLSMGANLDLLEVWIVTNNMAGADNLDRQTGASVRRERAVDINRKGDRS